MKLSNTILKAIFFTALISIALAFSINIFFQYNNFQDEKKSLKDEFIKQKKADLKKEVLKAYEYIDYHQKITEKKIKEKLKKRVQDAHNIALAIYNENKNIKTKDEIQYLIVTSLKNISFEERDYYFINTNKGKVVLFDKDFSIKKDKNIWNLQDSKGKYLIQKQSEIALKQQEGFLTNYFKKPDLKDNKQYPKLSYIKNFEPYNWHIGMGAYLDDMEEQIKKEILEYISSLRFGKDGYIFVNSLNKKALVFDGKRLTKPKDYPNDKLFIQQLNSIKNIEGDYFFYKFKKLNTIKEFPKMGFVKEYKKWGWLVGSGIYIDEIDQELAKKRETVKQIILSEANVLLLIFIIITLFIFFISKKISTYIEENISNLIKSFKKASLNLKEIDTNKLTYNEFKTLANNLNITLKEINHSQIIIKDYLEIINQNVIISSTNTKGIITEANEAFCKISGYQKEELIGKNHNIIKHPTMPKEIYTDMWNSLRKEKTWVGDLKNIKKNGDTYWVNITIHPKYDKKKLIGYTAVKHDITDKKRVEYLSITDELTQLYNRRFFNTKIEEELNRAKRDNHNITFLMIDIDYFKNYNDTYGHQSGDIVLQKVSQTLRDSLHRASDYGFRLGGEEFGIIFSNESKENSITFAKKIKDSIENLKIEHKDSKVSKYLTISVGVTIKNANEVNDSDEIYKLADKALYKAKEEGRNLIFCF